MCELRYFYRPLLPPADSPHWLNVGYSLRNFAHPASDYRNPVHRIGSGPIFKAQTDL